MYSRDTGRGNSREGGGSRPPACAGVRRRPRPRASLGAGPGRQASPAPARARARAAAVTARAPAARHDPAARGACAANLRRSKYSAPASTRRAATPASQHPCCPAALRGPLHHAAEAGVQQRGSRADLATLRLDRPARPTRVGPRGAGRGRLRQGRHATPGAGTTLRRRVRLVRGEGRGVST